VRFVSPALLEAMSDIVKVLNSALRSRWAAWSILTFAVLLLFVRFYRTEIVSQSALLRYYYDLYYLPYLAGKLPWRDFFFEYPPLALIFIFGFGLFVHADSYEQFVLLKSLFSGLLLATSLGVFAQFEIQQRGSWARSLLCAFVLHLMCNLVVATFDGVVFAAILAGSALILASNRLSGSVALLGAALVKVMPILAAPAVFRFLDRRDRWKFLGWAIVLVGINAWFVATGWQGFLGAFRYHSTRTIDAYSLWGAADMLLQKMGLSKGACEWKFATATITGTVAESLTKVATLTLLGVVAGLYVRAYRNRFRLEQEKVVWLVVVTTVAFVLFGKLGQPNYAIWVTACCTVAMVAFPTSLRREAMMWLLLLGYAVLSTLITRKFIGLAERTPGSSDLLLALGRSGLLLSLFVGMLFLWNQSPVRAVLTRAETTEGMD
jgi:hypothetical protein